MQPSISCEICSSPSRVWASIHDYRHFKCTRCGHVFVSPRPSQSELDSVYGAGDYYDRAAGERTRLLGEAAQRLKRLEKLCKRMGLPRQLLDIGCASGYFIKTAAQHDWSVTGIDRSAELVKQAQQYPGVRVVRGVLEQTAMPDGPFPVVTAWEVIEHAVAPKAFFASVASNVAPGGLLALSTPLANGVPARVMGVRFPMWTPPEHLSLFTRRSINILASEFDFEEIEYRSFSNLNSASLASGFVKLIFGKSINDVSEPVRRLLVLAGGAFSWLPWIIDRIGWGTEMEIVFRRKGI